MEKIDYLLELVKERCIKKGIKVDLTASFKKGNVNQNYTWSLLEKINP